MNSKLLYQQGQHHGNIHNYIKNKTNIIIFGKTEQGKIVAAYTSDGVKDGMVNEWTKGCLFSINKRKVYRSKPEVSVGFIHHNDIIFGNKELIFLPETNEVIINDIP